MATFPHKRLLILRCQASTCGCLQGLLQPGTDSHSSVGFYLRGGSPFQLLTVNPEHRFSSLQDMQTAPSLAHVLWDELSEKKVEPGFVPNVSYVRPDR